MNVHFIPLFCYTYHRLSLNYLSMLCTIVESAPAKSDGVYIEKKVHESLPPCLKLESLRS